MKYLSEYRDSEVVQQYLEEIYTKYLLIEIIMHLMHYNKTIIILTLKYQNGRSKLFKNLLRLK